MKKTTRTARKVLSVFLAVLMMLTTWAVAVPGLVLAAETTYYVRVYMNIYDGANDDGYGNAYTVVSDINSEFYGKPDDYKWYNGGWFDRSAGYSGDINMAGFTLFYDNDTKYVTYDLSADLVAATTTLGNNWTSMDDLTLDNFADCENKVEKVYGFTVTAIPSSLFWVNDENNAVNGETSFGFYKITVAKDEDSEEYVLWEGLSGSESYMYCYYGTITPDGIITPWDDCPDEDAETFYKDYTTSFADIWFLEPTATSVAFDEDTINYTIPKLTADDSGSKFTRSAKVYDQYGGEMDLTPTSYYVTDANGNVLNNDSIYYSNGAVYIKKSLQTLYPNTTTNTFYLVADYNGITGRIQLNLTNPTYTVNYTNVAGEIVDLLTAYGVYGQELASSTLVNFSSATSDNGNGTHNVYAYPATVTVTGDMTVTPVATAEPHNVTSYTTVTEATYDAPGEEQGTCTKCNATVTREIPQLTDGNAPVITLAGNGNAESAIFCGDVNVAVADSRSFTLAVTKDGEDYAVADTASFTLTEAGTYVITATDASDNVATKTVTINVAHTVESWTSADENNHSGTCTVCGETVIAAHTFTNSALTRPTQNADGTWTDGYYTRTCVCGETKTEPAVRADYSELEKAVAELEALENNENLSDEAKAVIANALADAGKLDDNLVTAEQGDIDALVKELEEIKADADEAIKNKELGINDITEATSGVKVQFIDASGLGTIESVQLGEDEGFIIRVANGNADSNITITSVSGVTAEAKTLEPGKSADYRVEMPAAAGIYEYAITYTIDGLKNADGTAVTATTKAYLYVKAAAFTPYHLMDEDCANNLPWEDPATSEWDYTLESAIGDFAPVYNNKAPKAEFGNDNLQIVKGSTYVYDLYDYEDNKCFAGCTGTGNTPYVKGDAHAATYRYYIDTSLASTWQDAGFKAVIAETYGSLYDNTALKYIRLANNQAYLDAISETDKTFSVTLVPGKSSNVPTKTWTTSSSGDLTVSYYQNDNEDEYVFGNYLDEAQTWYTAYENFAGYIPQKTEDAKMMFSTRMEYNKAEGGVGAQAEATTMTTHLYITSYDKAALREAVANAETAGYNSAYFDAEKYEAYENALKTAKEVLGKAETSQTEVDAAKDALNAAIADLAADEAEAKFVLTVTHSIHNGKDRNSENPDTSNKDYYLLATSESVNAPLLGDTVLATYNVNKHDDAATFAIENNEDTNKGYHYWYIDYSGVQDAIDAADAIINDTENGYSEEYKQQAQTAKDALEDILDGKDATTTPTSQSTVDDALDAVTALTGHTCNEDVVIPAEAATCTATGLTAGAKCSVCGKIIVEQTETAALGHTFTDFGANAATCLAPGNVAYKQCTVCNLYFAADAETNSEDGKTDTTSFVLEQLDHSYTGEYKWNNAGEIKYHSQKCVNGCDQYGEEVPCTFETVTVEPTCTENGTETHTCTVCNNSYQTFTSANGHDWSDWDLTTAPTKDAEGTYTRTCSKGDATETKSVALEDYSAYDAAVERAEGMLESTTLTDAAKAEIQSALTEAEKLDQNLPADVVEDGETIIDNTSDVTIADATNALTAVLDKINNDTTGAYVKPDSSAAEDAVAKAEALEEKIELPADVKTQIDELREELNGILEEIAKDDNATEAEYKDELKVVEDAANAILEKYEACEKDGHKFGAETIATYPVYDEDAKTWSQGTYTCTCSVCGYVKTIAYDRANYEAYDDALAELNELLADDSITQATKTAIREVINENTIPNNLMTPDQDVVTNAANALKAEADKINNDTTGAYEKVDYTNYDNAVNAYEALKDVMTAEDESAVEAIKAPIDAIPDDGTAAQYQTQVDKAAADIAAINAKYGDCASGNHTWGEPVLTKKPTADAKGEYTETCGVCGATQITEVERADYDAFDDAVKALEDLAKTENLTTEAAKAIADALAKAEALDKNLPADATTVDGKLIEGGQDEIDALVAQLQQVVANTNTAIGDGSALLPDYEAWELAEGTYDALDKTNVKSEVIAEADALKAEIAEKQDDDTLTQATATQAEIDTATGRLNEIIGGINDGSLVKPNYTDAETAIENAETTDSLTDADKEALEDLKEALEEIKNDPTSNKKDDQTAVDEIKNSVQDIINKYADCENGNHNWGAPELTKKPTADAQGEYTETCGTCGATQITKVDLADYEAFNEAVKALKELANTENLTAEAAKAITDALAEADALDKNLPADVTTVDGKEIKGGQDTIDALVTELNGVVADTKADIADGSALAPDYEAWELAEGTYDALDKTNVKSEIIAEADALKAEIAEKQANTNHTQATATQTQINEATAKLNAIITGIENGSHIKPADYTKVDKDLADAKDKADKNDVTDGVKEDIKTIEDKLNEIRNDSATNANDQDEIDALGKQLEDIIAGIKDGTLVKPDFGGYDGSHEDYEELVIQYGDKIKDGVADDVADLDTIVEGVRNDETATKADDQTTVDNAKTDLDKIIEGIIDGTLRDPDYTEVDKDLADAKDKADDSNVAAGVKEDIKDIEDKLNEIKNDPTTNANDQEEIDALEDDLEKIIEQIEAGAYSKPDYSAWNAAEADYNALDLTNVKEEILVEAAGLKRTVNEIKVDPNSTKADDQKTVDDATAKLIKIIAGINDGSLKHPDYSDVDEKLEDLKDEKNLIDATDARIDEIETAIENLKKDESTNAKENQDDVDALEKELDDIIAGIADGSLVKPDYTEADKAIKDAEKAIADIEEKLGDTLNADENATLEELKKELEELKKSLDELKNDPASNKKDDQATVDSIRDGAKEIINSTKVITDKYAECLKGNHVKGALIKVVNPTCTEKGYSVYICEVCGKEIKADYIDATGHTDTDEDGTCDICGATGLYDGCTCLCHNNHWFWRIVYMIIRIIWKIFGMHQVCPCGRLHY